MKPAANLTVTDHVAVITLDRPVQANVLDEAMLNALATAVRAVADGVAVGEVRSVLLCGSGAHFCAGGDIRQFAAGRDDLPGVVERGIAVLHELMVRLVGLPVPVISALNGSVGGAGIGLALCADIALAAESMKLRGGYTAIGLTPDGGSSWVLARLAGPMRARQILMTNRPWSARQCLEAGLVAEVHPDAALPGVAVALAGALAQGSSGAQARIKRLVEAAATNTLEQHLDLERECMIASAAHADAREGVTAFLEKRPPRFA